jgi:gluconolactonase
VRQASPSDTAPVTVQRLALVVEAEAHEGPVYAADEDALYFTTIPRPGPEGPRVAIKRLALDGERFPLEPSRVQTVREHANVANGMALDGEGRLVVCEQGTFSSPAAITRMQRSGEALETLVEAWKDRPLNSPNDVVVARDGAIWFTDPSYGSLQGFRPAPAVGDHVYRYDPGGARLARVADGFDKPNGLAFSRDEGVLYVADNGAPHELLAFVVEDGDRLGARCTLADFPAEHPDGLKVDRAGRIYASTPSGVRILAPDGEPLGEIAVPGAVNFAWGGPDGSVLFITADTAIWAAVLDTQGA